MITLNTYRDNYHDAKGTFKDFFQTSIRILPITSNPASCSFDDSCGFDGVAGRFFRNLYENKIDPIDDIKDQVIKPLHDFLTQDKEMSEGEADRFIKIALNIVCPSDKLSVIDASFIKYLPYAKDARNKKSKSSDKYVSGQKKLADFLSSANTYTTITDSTDKKDLFTNIIKAAFEHGIPTKKTDDIEEYYIFPFLKKQFSADFEWIMGRPDSVIVKYIDLLLNFYSCYIFTQTLIHISPKYKAEDYFRPLPLYFILAAEKASMKSEVITKGWEHYLPAEVIGKTFSRLQAWDILNCLTGVKSCCYTDVISALNDLGSFESNRETLMDLLREFHDDKWAMFDNRPTSKNPNMPREVDYQANSYEEFITLLFSLCEGLQEYTYDLRMRKRVYDLMMTRFLSLRRGKRLLNLDNEMLIFLIAMMTREKKTRLDNVYKKFSEYGIFFNMTTRKNIEQYLLKLNLLDRKSDSGEAQYVTVVL